VRTKDSAFLALLQGDALDLVALVEIVTTAGTLRYALDTDVRVWNGLTFAPNAGLFTEIKESAERQIPGLQLVLQNADGVLGPLLYPGAGGEDIRGKRVTIRQAARSMLTGSTPTALVIEWVFFVASCQWIGREAVSIDLGVFPADTVRVPDRTCQGLRCRWLYKGAHCGYVGSLATCAQTVDDCRNHFPGQFLRFGGFPSAADARALVVQ